MIFRLVVLSLALAGCRSEPAPAPGPAEDAALSGTQVAAAPATFAELAPGDTAAVILIMRRTMEEIEAALPGLTRRDTTLAPEPNQEARRLSIWLEDGVPRKLVVSEPNDAGQMMDESIFWFVQGEVRVVQQPTAAYAFDADRILVWTDENLVPLTDITPDVRMIREREVLEQQQKWLALLGVTLP